MMRIGDILTSASSFMVQEIFQPSEYALILVLDYCVCVSLKHHQFNFATDYITLLFNLALSLSLSNFYFLELRTLISLFWI